VLRIRQQRRLDVRTAVRLTDPEWIHRLRRRESVRFSGPDVVGHGVDLRRAADHRRGTRLGRSDGNRVCRGFGITCGVRVA
jgi:hypothetical protein